MAFAAILPSAFHDTKQAHIRSIVSRYSEGEAEIEGNRLYMKLRRVSPPTVHLDRSRKTITKKLIVPDFFSL